MSDEERIQETRELLSAVSGLPVKNEEYRPVDLDSFPMEEGLPAKVIPTDYVLDLGEYVVQIGIQYIRDKFGMGRISWDPVVRWNVRYRGEIIGSEHHSMIGSTSLDDVSSEIRSSRLNIIAHSLGGIDIETAFMDYGSYSTAGLKGDDSYFNTIYLVMMCHMKERGLVLPKNLGKDPEVRELRENGSVEQLERILAPRISKDPRLKRHNEVEAESIIRYARRVRRHRDPNLGLFEKMPDLDYHTIGGRGIFPEYTILVVENDLHFDPGTPDLPDFLDTSPSLKSMVVSALERDGRFGGTRIIETIALAHAAQYCETGQVSLVLFDWRKPSHEEAMMFFDEMPRVNLTYGQLGLMTEEGSCLQPVLADMADKLDIRERWMDYIRRQCEGAGKSAPPYEIIRAETDLVRRITDKLNPLAMN